MVIRHPFTRLVSAFNHLFRWGLHDENFLCANTTEVLQGCETQNSALAQMIIKQTQPDSNDTLLHFPDFVRFLINRGNEFATLKKQVTFHWSGLASHWQPFSSHCSPCDLLPHIVLELENLSEELPFVLEWSGLVRIYGEFPTLPRKNQNQVETRKVLMLPGLFLADRKQLNLTHCTLLGLLSLTTKVFTTLQSDPTDL